MQQKKYGEAVIEFRNAIRIDPRFADAYYQLSQAALAQHDWTGAYVALGKAIDLDPALLDARLERAQLYMAARQFDKAEAGCQYGSAKGSQERQEPTTSSALHSSGSRNLNKRLRRSPKSPCCCRTTLVRI